MSNFLHDVSIIMDQLCWSPESGWLDALPSKRTRQTNVAGDVAKRLQSPGHVRPAPQATKHEAPTYAGIVMIYSACISVKGGR